MQDESERNIALAWHTAAFSRTDKLPSLGSLIGKSRRGAATATKGGDDDGVDRVAEAREAFSRILTKQRGSGHGN